MHELLSGGKGRPGSADNLDHQETLKTDELCRLWSSLETCLQSCDDCVVRLTARLCLNLSPIRTV